MKITAHMPFDDYRAAEGVNYSRLRLLKHSPARYKRNPEFAASQAQSLGTLVHLAVLEPDRFAETVHVAPMRRDMRTAAYREWLEALPDGSTIVTDAELDQALTIALAVRENRECAQLLSNAQTELSLFWEDEKTGLQCKARVDIYSVGAEADLKTCRDATAPAFGWDAHRWGYWMQRAWYRRGLRACGLSVGWSGIIAVETGPHPVAVLYECPQPFLDVQDAEIDEMLATIVECEGLGVWPGIVGGELPYHGRAPDEEALVW